MHNICFSLQTTRNVRSAQILAGAAAPLETGVEGMPRVVGRQTCRRILREHKGPAGCYPCRPSSTADLIIVESLNYGLLRVSGVPAGGANGTPRKFTVSSVLLPSTSLYAWPGSTV
jgi:hypothetical protein